jgi:hypothetical protein
MIDVAGPHAGSVDLLSVLDDTQRRTRQVDVVAAHHAGMLGGLPADQGRTDYRQAAAIDSTMAVSRSGVERADRHVVDEGQGSAPGAARSSTHIATRSCPTPVHRPAWRRPAPASSHSVGGQHEHRARYPAGEFDPGRESSEASHHPVVQVRSRSTRSRRRGGRPLRGRLPASV